MRRVSTFHGLLLLMCVSAGALWLQYYLRSRNMLTIPVHGSAYAWPRGCEQKRYTRGDAISEYCMVARYRVADWERFPIWPMGRDTQDYYRIGNDIVDIACPWSASAKCHVTSVLRNAYSQ